MKFELLEGDELCQPDGRPRNIIVVIEGKRGIMPTSKTLLDLLDIAKMAGIEPSKTPIEQPASLESIKTPTVEAKIESGDIEREDLVTCVKVLPRAEGVNVDIVEGGTYRVLSIQRQSAGETTVVKYYEVIDDSAPVQRRIVVFPQEVMLAKKHGFIPKPIHRFEEIYPCGYCGEQNALVLDAEKNKYVGECKACHKPLEMERPGAKSVS